MKINALFLDFYGTVVHEDDDIIPLICQEIQDSSTIECNIREIGTYWWKAFAKMFNESSGITYETQRSIGLRSLTETIDHFKSSGIAEEIISKHFSHWQKPGIFEDSKPFLDSLTSDILGAQKVGIKTIWMNRKQKQATNHIRPDYIYSNVLELKELL